LLFRGVHAPFRRIARRSTRLPMRLRRRRLSVRSLTRQAHVSWPRFSLCLACPERLLCSRDGLGAPDTVLGSAEQNEPLGRATENNFLSDGPQITLEADLVNAAGDALVIVIQGGRFCLNNTVNKCDPCVGGNARREKASSQSLP
jgi:hypothetical protein